MAQSILLPLLADGEFRSGQALADALGVSRTAVWKQVNKIARDSGLAIESVKGRGYRIPGGLDLLDEQAVRRELDQRPATLLSQLQIVADIDSTNAALQRLAQEGGISGVVCSAEQQSAGRGRRGRTWVSPFASNLYVSLLWQFHQGAAALEGLSLAVGVAIARALDNCAVAGVQLKWPNDILYNGAKLGGVLIEMTGDADGTCDVVIGIGLNVAMPGSAATDIDQDWTDVKSICGAGAPGRNRLLGQLLNELLPLVADYERDGFAPWREPWQQLDAFADAPVVLNTGSGQVAGTARGVDARGALRLETTTGVQAMYGGEISMRPAS